MNGIELLQVLTDIFGDAVLNGVRSDAWNTKLSNLHLTDK